MRFLCPRTYFSGSAGFLAGEHLSHLFRQSSSNGDYKAIYKKLTLSNNLPVAELYSEQSLDSVLKRRAVIVSDLSTITYYVGEARLLVLNLIMLI